MGTHIYCYDKDGRDRLGTPWVRVPGVLAHDPRGEPDYDDEDDPRHKPRRIGRDEALAILKTLRERTGTCWDTTPDTQPGGPCCSTPCFFSHRYKGHDWRTRSDLDEIEKIVRSKRFGWMTIG